MRVPLLPAFSISSLTAFDWFLVVVVTLSTAFAFKRGIIRVFFSLAGLIAGTMVAGMYCLQVALKLSRWVTQPAVAEAIAFLVIFFAVAIVFGMVGAVVRKTVKAAGLGFADRVLGAAIGLVRGVLLGAAAVAAIAAFLPRSGWLKQSELAPYFLAEAHAVAFVVPPHFQDQLSAGARRIREKKPRAANGDAPAE